MKFLPWLVVFVTVYLSSFMVFISYRNGRYSTERLREFMKLDFMTEALESRKEFDFSITPWKIDAKKSRNPSVLLRQEDIRWSFVVFVKSHSSHRLSRLRARMTWSSYELIGSARIETVFIVGNPENEQERISLENENKKYGDLLQIDLNEKYKSIGLKTLAGMQYAAANFPPDWIYASCDDDIVPDWVQFIEEWDKARNATFTQEYQRGEGCSIDGHFPIICGFGAVPHALPKRDLDSKWYLSMEEYSLPEFPTYCFGGLYAMTVKLANELYQMSRKLSFFWIDDVWITGFLRLKRFYDSTSFCQYQGRIGLWSDSNVAYSSTGTENELLLKWTDYVAKIREKQFILVNQKTRHNQDTVLRYDWDSWLDYVLSDRHNAP